MAISNLLMMPTNMIGLFSMPHYLLIAEEVSHFHYLITVGPSSSLWSQKSK